MNENIHTRLTQADVMAALQTVCDPEIPVISVVDLGVISDVEINEEGTVKVGMTPTFAGCPAIGVMKADIEKALAEIGATQVEVTVLYSKPWSTNNITEKGRILLRDFGFSPPPRFDGVLSLNVLRHAICPRCASNNTTLISPFGPTACRAVHKCNNCLETFQQFKPL
jgi:ring-1,2-phenylacetyl-CoA epoxidase subunit PaaD